MSCSWLIRVGFDGQCGGLSPIILITDGKAQVIRRRETIADLLAAKVVPE